MLIIWKTSRFLAFLTITKGVLYSPCTLSGVSEKTLIMITPDFSNSKKPDYARLCAQVTVGPAAIQDLKNRCNDYAPFGRL